MTQGDTVPPNATDVMSTTELFTTTTTEPGSKRHPVNDRSDSRTQTDTLAAVTIAFLAVVLVISLTLIVRTVRRRRRMQRGEELDHIPTVSAGIMSASVAAYSRGQRARPQERGVISWEPVIPSSTVTAEAAASSSSASAMSPSNC
ncbi:uncharacterized protein LOC143285414 [Babylonia areolata]|uniref:uncharacterized protein LOC143285414 n=1 Tax=Babylonia areolata TaxID=304850 RepID=UPI003FD1D571